MGLVLAYEPILFIRYYQTHSISLSMSTESDINTAALSILDTDDSLIELIPSLGHRLILKAKIRELKSSTATLNAEVSFHHFTLRKDLSKLAGFSLLLTSF